MVRIIENEEITYGLYVDNKLVNLTNDLGLIKRLVKVLTAKGTFRTVAYRRIK